MIYSAFHVNVTAKESDEIVSPLLREGLPQQHVTQRVTRFSTNLNGAVSHCPGRAIKLLYIPDG